MMLKRVLPAVAGLVALFVLVAVGWHFSRRNAEPVLPDDFLSAAEIEEAIAYGLEKQDVFLAEFTRPWTVDHGYGHLHGGGRATVFTPYLTLALMARNAARAGFEISPEELVRLLRRDYRQLRVEIVFYGPDMHFDRDYRLILLDDEREIEPARVVRRDYDQAREYTITARWDCYFAHDELDGLEEILFRLVRPGKEPIDFVFDSEGLR